MQTIYWLVLFVVLLVIEIITMGLTTIWFAGGALVAYVAGLLGANLTVQVLLFLVVSIVTFVLTRPLAEKYLNRGREKTNAESLIGETALVTEEIDELTARGRVEVRGQDWAAKAAISGETIPKGAAVTVEAIEGVKLLVKVKEES